MVRVRLIDGCAKPCTPEYTTVSRVPCVGECLSAGKKHFRVQSVWHKAGSNVANPEPNGPRGHAATLQVTHLNEVPK